MSADEYGKEDARDFVLWKAAEPEDEAVGAAWDAPFGRGRPGLAPRVLGDGAGAHPAAGSAPTCSTSTPAAWT